MDLDWFWRGWFYSTDHVDISLDRVHHLRVDTSNPDVEETWAREQFEDELLSRTQAYNLRDGISNREDRMPDLRDLYSENDEFTVTDKDRNEFDDFLEGLTDELNSDPEWMRRSTSAPSRRT